MRPPPPPPVGSTEEDPQPRWAVDELTLEAKSRLRIGATSALRGGARRDASSPNTINANRIVVAAGAVLEVASGVRVTKLGTLRPGDEYDESGPGIVAATSGRKRLNPSRTYRSAIVSTAGVMAESMSVAGTVRIGDNAQMPRPMGADGPLHVSGELVLRKGGSLELNVNDVRTALPNVGDLAPTELERVSKTLSAATKTDLDALSTFEGERF